MGQSNANSLPKSDPSPLFFRSYFDEIPSVMHVYINIMRHCIHFSLFPVGILAHLSYNNRLEKIFLLQ